MKLLIILISIVTLFHHSYVYSEPDFKFSIIDDLQVEYIDIGQGDVNIVIESGVGMGASYWLPLLPELKKLDQRIIIYSRAGNGNSSPAVDVSLTESNKRLHLLLKSINANSNILLVGHSYGGLHVREYAASYQTDVVGLVLLDPSHEKFSKKLHQLDKSWAEKDDTRLNTILANNLEWRNLQRIYNNMQLTDKGVISNISTVVVTSSKLNESDWWIGHSTKGKAMWRGLHSSLISENPNSVHIVSNLTGHNIPIDNPSMVIKAINLSLALIGSL